MKLEGTRALITGASGGIGSAIAKLFHKEGAHVCISGRNKQALEDLSQTLGERCSVWIADLAKPEEVKNLVPSIEKEGPIDILVNNGGILLNQICFRMNDDLWDTSIRVNLTSAFQLCREALKGMIKRKNGRIINISSILAFTGGAQGQVNYVSAKAGLIGLTKAIALEVARRKITVNAIAPGYIDTEMTRSIPDHIKEKIIPLIPLGAIGRPEDIANGALFLAQKESSYITGQTLHINGGMGMF